MKHDVIHWLLIAFSVALAAWFFSRVAVPEEATDHVARAIQVLQPRVMDDRAARLSGIIREATDDAWIDPLLVVALIMRESSFSPQIERLERFGERDERGLTQMMPGGPWREVLPDGCTEELVGARCQIHTGVRWLATARQRCPGSWWRWVAAYGMSRCPTEEQARMTTSPRRARGLYIRAGGERWE